MVTKLISKLLVETTVMMIMKLLCLKPYPSEIKVALVLARLVVVLLELEGQEEIVLLLTLM